ncbi:MAG: hypothetical protein KDI30_00500 [Pseudomonadales bacterium]|nr:hypothetical protein [Pseudomonadales bacterium]
MTPKSTYSLFIVVIVTAVLLIGEFILLPALSGLNRETLLMGFAGKPGSEIDGQLINTMGFTGDVIEIEKQPGTVRILILGGSVMFNRHLGERLKPQLQALLPGKKLELVNAGLRSHTTRSSLLKMRLLQKYQFDYVFIYHGINDLWANHIDKSGYRPDYSHLNSWYERSAVLDHSTIARSIFNTWRMIKPLPVPQYIFPDKANVNRCAFCSVKSLEENLEEISSIAEASGSRIVLITFASNIPENYSRKKFLENTVGYINPEDYDRRDIFNWGPPDYVREGLKRHNTALKTLATKKHLALWDADQILSPHIEWFGDACHFNNEGVDRFIEGLGNFIKTEALFEPGRPE